MCDVPFVYLVQIRLYNKVFCYAWSWMMCLCFSIFLYKIGREPWWSSFKEWLKINSEHITVLAVLLHTTWLHDLPNHTIWRFYSIEEQYKDTIVCLIVPSQWAQVHTPQLNWAVWQSAFSLACSIWAEPLSCMPAYH